jgi:gas vesicle protein GvpL/GvpF
MTAQANDRRADDRRQTGDARGGAGGASADKATAVYVYGILPCDVELRPGFTGVGDPPGEVRLVRNGDLAALVSDIRLDRPLGGADDLYAHEQLLDATASAVPVLPLRFGSVLTDDDAVAGELLDANYDEFTAALAQLDGQAEYIVKGRYREGAVLREVLDENPQAATLRERIRDADPDASRDERIELGQIVSEAVAAKREQDTRALGDAISGMVTGSLVRPATHELDAVYAAFLVAEDQTEPFSEAVSRLAEEWQDRIELRLIGPLAAYDFVGGAPAAGL